ncbi:MAG: alpha-N-acetylglucosaminidase [Alphaproteobacteria bacterium]|nr:alpha-N-acetylglucosaminidase [Alphaproteobacteria bacterium]
MTSQSILQMRMSRRVAIATAAAAAASTLPGVGLGTTASARQNNVRTAQDVLQRLIGDRAKDFDFALVGAGPGELPFYSVDVNDGRVAVAANSSVGLLRGAYAYLRAVGATQMNWEGDRVALPQRWPGVTTAPVATPFQHRVYFNPCTYGYTMPFWDWPRWQREIDWMALHGIDMPLALEGQEYIWHALWIEEDLSQAECDAYFSGPAFLPWHRMGNIEGYATPLPANWIEKKHQLQLRILERLRALGMTPVLPAFAGYVPKAFAQKHPEARIHKMAPWGGFHETYWLDPLDPLFAPLAKRFLDLYGETYGEGTHYLADSFNEMRPPIAPNDGSGKTLGREAQLAAYGRAIYESIRMARPQAVFVMQGWLFSFDPEFWNPASVDALLKDIPDDKAMVLDIANDSFPGVWKKDKAYYGKRWVFGYIHNFGGNNPLFGDFDLYCRDLTDLSGRKDTGNLAGFGVFPEGLNTNSVVYEYLFDLAWPAKKDETTEAWLADYLRARYGHADAALLSAWSDLRQAVYRKSNWSSAWWEGAFGTYLFCKRPKPEMIMFDQEPKDLTLLMNAVSGLSALSDRYGREPLFRYDLIAACSHAVSLTMDQKLIAALKALEAGDIRAADRAWARVKILCLKLDSLLGAQPQGLARWIDEARRYGDSSAEAKYYVENAKTQVTVWGGDAVLKDYASKAWQGLYRDFYLPRWRKFYSAMRTAKRDHTAFDSKRFDAEIAAWEWAWAKDPRGAIRRVPDRPYDDVKTLLTLI